MAQMYAILGKRPGIQNSYPFRASVRFRVFGANMLVWANISCSFTTQFLINLAKFKIENSPVFTVLWATSESIHWRSRQPENARLADTTNSGIICHWAVHRMKIRLCYIVTEGPNQAWCMASCTLPLILSYLKTRTGRIRPQDIILKYWGNQFSSNNTQLRLVIISVSSILNVHSDFSLYVGFF